MNHYLLSVHSAPGASCHNQAPEEMQASMKRIEALESEMKAADVLYLSGRLSGPKALALLADHHDYPWGICNHAEGREPELFTTAAVVADLGQRTLHVVRGSPCANWPVSYSM